MNVETNPVEGLERVLKEQIDLFEKYTNLLETDQGLMTALKIDEIEINNKAKNTLLLKIQALDQARQTYIARIAETEGMTQPQIRLEELAQRMPTANRLRMLTLRQNLLDVTNRLKTVQETTTTLAQTSLKWINGSMGTLKRMLQPNEIYGASGRVDSTGAFTGRTVEKRA